VVLSSTNNILPLEINTYFMLFLGNFSDVRSGFLLKLSNIFCGFFKNKKYFALRNQQLFYAIFGEFF